MEASNKRKRVEVDANDYARAEECCAALMQDSTHLMQFPDSKDNK